ncbi:MAG: A/G-specific adenine glycosylase [Alphaproteobacteria bacterium]
MAALKNQDKKDLKRAREYRGRVLDWYDVHGRDLPWRYKGGVKADPYRVWLSEIMCQQTTVSAVKPYYAKFLGLWPSVTDLAAAENDAVMAAWAGLGYYARARNLHKCAKVVVEEHGGAFPRTQAALIKLPGIGDYTSAAIAAICFGEAATVMDGNIERIMARFFAIEDALPKAKPVFKGYTAHFFDNADRAGDLAQGLMDVGSSICTPKNPKCGRCPLEGGCAGKGIAESLPVKVKAKKRPQKVGEVYWVINDQGEVLFHRRPDKGLLGGMVALPTSSWAVKDFDVPDFIGDAVRSNHTIDHVFTHFDLTLHLSFARVDASPEGYFWALPEDCGEALPSVFKKAYNKFVGIENLG